MDISQIFYKIKEWFNMAKKLMLDKVCISAAGDEMMTRGLDDNGVY